MKTHIIIKDYETRDYKDLIHTGYPFTTSDWGSAYKDLKLKILNITEKSETKRLVAFSLNDKKAVGIVVLTKVTNSLWILWHIFVSPNYRRCGISLLLHEASFDYLRKRGVKKAVAQPDITNIPVMKGFEKMWDGFLSQTIYQYCGNIRRIPNKSQKEIVARRFRTSDQDAMFTIYKQCTHEDWRSFLGINESNFLNMFVGYITYRGPYGILFERQTLVFEGEDGTIKGYAIGSIPRWPLRRQTAKFYLFISPQLLPDDAISIIDKMLRAQFPKSIKKVTVSSINRNEKLLLETSKMLCADFNFKVFQYMVPIKKL